MFVDYNYLYYIKERNSGFQTMFKQLTEGKRPYWVGLWTQQVSALNTYNQVILFYFVFWDCVLGVREGVPVLKETLKTTGRESLKFVWHWNSTVFLSTLLRRSPVCLWKSPMFPGLQDKIKELNEIISKKIPSIPSLWYSFSKGGG